MDFYKKKRYRVSNSTIVPYVCTYDTNLKRENGPLEPDLLPIYEVIVGPVAHQENMVESIKELLEDQGYSASIVKKSIVPYRG